MKIDPSIKLYPLISDLSNVPEICTWVSNKTFEEIYNTCPHVKWLMAFYIACTKFEYPKYVLVGALCVNKGRRKITAKKSIVALDAALAYGRGEYDEIPHYVLEESGQVRGDDAGYATHNHIHGASRIQSSYKILDAIDNALALIGGDTELTDKKFADIFRQHVKLEDFLA